MYIWKELADKNYIGKDADYKRLSYVDRHEIVFALAIDTIIQSNLPKIA